MSSQRQRGGKNAAPLGKTSVSHAPANSRFLEYRLQTTGKPGLGKWSPLKVRSQNRKKTFRPRSTEYCFPQAWDAKQCDKFIFER